MENAKLIRGKKWFNVRKKYEFEKREKDIEWMDSQESIVNDIKYYEDSIKPKGKK